MPYALCPMPYALCPLPYALCPMPYALCPMPYALCPMLYLLEYVIHTAQWSPSRPVVMATYIKRASYSQDFFSLNIFTRFCSEHLHTFLL
jgi:hypothetical protein